MINIIKNVFTTVNLEIKQEFKAKEPESSSCFLHPPFPIILPDFLLLLFRYCLEKEDANDYVLCDVIGQTGADSQWKRECFRVVGDNERPLMLQSLWKPKEGFSRRFEIQRRVAVQEQSLKDTDTITAGIPVDHTSPPWTFIQKSWTVPFPVCIYLLTSRLLGYQSLKSAWRAFIPVSYCGLTVFIVLLITS